MDFFEDEMVRLDYDWRRCVGEYLLGYGAGEGGKGEGLLNAVFGGCEYTLVLGRDREGMRG